MNIVRQGWLLKRGEYITNWRARYFVLMDDGTLLGFKHSPRPGDYSDPCNNFTVKKCYIVIFEGRPHYPFSIKGLSHEQEIERTFSAGDPQDRELWCNAIKETALRLHQMEQNRVLQELLLPTTPSMLPTSSDDTDMLIGSNPNNPTTISAASTTNNNNNDNISSTNGSSAPTPSSSNPNHHALQQTSNQQIQMLTHNNNNSFKNRNNNNNHMQQQSSLDMSDRKRKSLNDFDPIKLIGRGNWGKVMLSSEKATGCLYAIKILKKNVIISQNEVGHTLTESRVLRITNHHPFLIALKYSFRDGERLCFVMEFAGGGELFYHLSRERRFNEDKTRFYAAEIVSALGYLHGHDIIYRDLKLENLLLGWDGHIKIADFGLCKDNMTINDTTKTFCGTPEYLSPEVVEDLEYGLAVDWWSLGVLLYEMMCGTLPFDNKTTDKLFREILCKPVTFPITLSENAKSLLDGLLQKKPEERLGGGKEDAAAIMSHPFFRGLDWQDLVEKKIRPPFVPEVSSQTDTRYFDRQFTAEPVNLTPIDRPTNMQNEVEASYFTQFSFAAGSHMSHR